ncbi:MAG: hypothetical protein IKY16_06485 [Bacteroidales bacterium]|nr:hypothetical protein [Bacteroidales bacterium]
MNNVLHMTYTSSLTNLCELNSSFDMGVLRICYHGQNRNGSAIDKNDLERCIPTLYNCPVVCHYNRENDTLGGHDMEIVTDSDGTLRLVNLTQPIGVIPESANVWFEEYEEDDGTVHEYLYADVLLWKRQEAYKKIKEDGITSHSMEITVKDGEVVDGIYHIHDFEFTAFALIGVEPCFESSALEVFSKQNFKEELAEMMCELKDTIIKLVPSVEDNDIKTQSGQLQNSYSKMSADKKFNEEGGLKVLDEKMSLAAKYGIDPEKLDFSLDDFSIEELTEKFEAMKMPDGTGEPEAEPQNVNNFELTSNMVEEIERAVGEVKIVREWGEYPRYRYVDSDFDTHEVYCWDAADWLLYGFTYSMDGDRAVVDFDSKKRKKYSVVDFNDPEQTSPFAEVFTQMDQKLQDAAGIAVKYQNASDTIGSMENELGVLRKFKEDTENAIAKNAREEIFAQFEDLIGVEAFETLRADCMNIDIETVEEKCYAIRGRNGTQAKFALEGKAPKIKVEKNDMSKEPYGGIFVRYGISAEN